MHDSSSPKQQPEKPYPRRCANCGKVAVEPVRIAYDAEARQDGKLHRFHIDDLEIDRCGSCSEQYFTNRSDERITAALRNVLGLLQPEEIRQRLSELALSQREFAERIGVAPETVSRWIHGTAVQTRALDNLMRLFFTLDDVREALVPASRTGGA